MFLIFDILRNREQLVNKPRELVVEIVQILLLLRELLHQLVIKLLLIRCFERLIGYGSEALLQCFEHLLYRLLQVELLHVLLFILEFLNQRRKLEVLYGQLSQGLQFFDLKQVALLTAINSDINNIRLHVHQIVEFVHFALQSNHLLLYFESRILNVIALATLNLVVLRMQVFILTLQILI